MSHFTAMVAVKSATNPDDLKIDTDDGDINVVPVDENNPYARIISYWVPPGDHLSIDSSLVFYNIHGEGVTLGKLEEDYDTVMDLMKEAFCIE